MSKDSHVTTQTRHSFPVREKKQKFIELENFAFQLISSLNSSLGSLFMLLPFIFITFVVCTAEIKRVLCLLHPLEKFSLVSLDACDSFSLPFMVVSLSMPQIRGSCEHLKGSYDNHSSCLNCLGCFRSSCCSVCRSRPDLTWSLVEGCRHFSDRQMGTKKDAKVKEWKDSTSRNSSSSRPGLEQTVAQDDPPGSTADGHDDDEVASVLSLSSSGGERVRGNTGVPGSRSSQGTPGLSLKGQRTHRSTPARSHGSDLAGKYGVQAQAKDFEATLLGPNPPPCDSDRVMLSTDRSPRSESKRLVERPSSCDTGHNARLARKGSVQQSSVIRPVNSEHVPVTPGPGSCLMNGTRYRDPIPGTQGSVPPTEPGKPSATTTPGSPGSRVTQDDLVTLGDPVRPVYTGQKAKKEKTDQCLDQSELPVLNTPDRSVQLEHNVHKQPGNMPFFAG